MECLSLLFKLLVHQSKAQIIRFYTDLRGHIHIDLCNLFSGWEEKVNISMDIVYCSESDLDREASSFLWSTGSLGEEVGRVLWSLNILATFQLQYLVIGTVIIYIKHQVKVSGWCIFAHWDLIVKNVESWSVSVPIHPSGKRIYLDLNFLRIGRAGVTYLRNHLEYGSCLLYWNYNDGRGTKAEGEKFDVNYSRDLCWIFVLWMEEKYCWKTGVVLRGKLIILIQLQSTEDNSSRHQEMDHGHKCFSLRITSVM